MNCVNEKKLENNISKFIEDQEKPGIKYKGNQFLPKTKQIVDRKRSTKTKEEDAGRVLQKYEYLNKTRKRW